MEITKQWLEQQKSGLQNEVLQLEKDIYAKDGAIQAIEKIIEYLDKKDEVTQDGSNKPNNNKLSSVSVPGHRKR